MEAEYYKWYTNKDTDIKPNDGETVIIAGWYDGWHFNSGYYIKETNEIEFYDTPDNDRILLSDTEQWMMINDPNLQID